MPMLLDIQRKLFARSPRVKSLDLHPTQPWLIAGLYSGSVHLWNYDTGVLLNTFEVSQVPVRCVRFVARNNWFLAGSDDFHLRCFNYNTHEKIASFEAHPDYIRSIAVHPTASIVLTGSDDMTIRMWDWEKGWKLVQTFEGHTHFIMHLTINPKDSNTFASACLDRTVKVWTLNPSGSGSSYSRVEPNYTLDAHEKGVNYVEFYQGADRPYMVTTGDDRTVKIWDYLTKSCVQTLHGHTSNVSFAVFHPHLPLIISGAEDGSVRLWHSGTYRLERTLEYGLERAWCLAYRRNPNVSGGASLTSGAGINDVALGYDEGTVVIKLGKEDPTVSMDGAGKIVWTRNSEVRTANVGQGSSGEDAPSIPDGTRLPLSIRELGTTDLYAQSLTHSPNGRFVTVLGDGEYVIYTALAWRNKAFGSGLSFAWSSDSNTYAIRESGGRVRVYRSFKERVGLVNPGWKVEDTKSGALLGLVGNGFVCFHDWETGSLVRRIDVDVKNVYWSQSGTLVAIQTPDSFYILRFDRDAYNAYLESGEPVEDDGVEDAFELITEVAETVKTAKWTGECFIYTNSLNRLQYLVGEQINTVAHTDTELYLLGYMPQHGRVYLADKDMSIFSYSLSLAVVDYQTAILRGDLDQASNLLQTVPAEQRNKIARFLESQNLQQLALEVSTDPDHRFDLAISLDNFDTALEIARSGPQAGSESRWRTIGDKALERWNITLAKECFQKAGDLSALLLIGTSNNDIDLLNELIDLSIEKGATNIAFAAILQLGQRNRAIDLLLKTNRIPEAALFARTYKPERVSEIVKLWKSDLESTKRSKQNAIAKSIADPQFDSEVFEEGWENALKVSGEIKENHPVGNATNAKSNGKASKREIVGAEIEKMSGTKSNGAQAAPGEDLLA